MNLPTIKGTFYYHLERILANILYVKYCFQKLVQMSRYFLQS